MNKGETIMKITKARLKTIIMEEIQNIKSEGYIIIPEKLKNFIRNWEHYGDTFYTIEDKDIQYFKNELEKLGEKYQVSKSTTGTNSVIFTNKDGQYYWDQTNGEWGLGSD